MSLDNLILTHFLIFLFNFNIDRSIQNIVVNNKNEYICVLYIFNVLNYFKIIVQCRITKLFPF